MRIHRIFPRKIASQEDWSRALKKAVDSGAAVVWSEEAEWLRWGADSKARHPHLQWWVEKPWREISSGGEISGDRTIAVVDSPHDLQVLTDFSGPILLRPERRWPIEAFVESLPESLVDQLWFEFLPWRPEAPFRFTVGEIRKIIRLFERRFPTKKMRSPPGLEVWDDRMDPALEVEPLVSAQMESNVRASRPEISIIIPTINNSAFVQNVLRALLKQDSPRGEFEIILVDDGSSDNTCEQVRKLMAPEFGAVNFKMFFLPRPLSRRQGDNHYRAGIARNLGARYARGRYLQFLDSDILVSPGFLRRQSKLAKEFDVIQCVRRHIKPRFCHGVVDFEKIEIEGQTYVENGSYWEPFFQTQNWHSIPNFWKYTCTYCLLVPRDAFHEVGRFKRTYTTYGFEDVDLGYEFAKRGLKFYLSSEQTLHLTPERHKSEYGHSAVIRHQLLSRTAKTFFRQHLDPVIYDHFGGFMGEFAWWSRLKSSRLRGKWKTSKPDEPRF